MTSELLTLDMFGDKIGQAFLVEEADVPPIEFILVEATALRNYNNAARAPFSLLFTTQGRTVLPQRTYTLRHATLGLQPIFLVPIAGTQENVTYQAVFN